MHPVQTILAQGGYALVMIGVCSILALAVVIERCLALRRGHVLPASLLKAIDTFDANAAQTTFPMEAWASTPLGRIVATLISARSQEYGHALERMKSVGRVEVERLERGLTLLEIVAAATPLLGLLGTALGMMDVFRVITHEGLGDPRLLSDGISKALITTVAGLTVAIPALACHSLLSRRVALLASEMQERATALSTRLWDSRHAECRPVERRNSEI